MTARRRRMRLQAIALLAALLAPAGLRAEPAAAPGPEASSPIAAHESADPLVISVSQPEVRITSTFTGAELVVFGVARMVGADGPPPDVVVSVRGPMESFVTWRKSRVFGLWVNTQSRSFLQVPSFLNVQSSRPPDDMASPQLLREERLGLAAAALPRHDGSAAGDTEAEAFRLAFLRTRTAEGLYHEDLRGVTFLAPEVFRAQFAIPGRAPIGRYEISVTLLRNGAVAGQAQSHFEVIKTGFEQEIASFAQNDGLLYGITVAIGSLVVGFVGNFLFRKE